MNFPSVGERGFRVSQFGDSGGMVLGGVVRAEPAGWHRSVVVTQGDGSPPVVPRDLYELVDANALGQNLCHSGLKVGDASAAITIVLATAVMLVAVVTDQTRGVRVVSSGSPSSNRSHLERGWVSNSSFHRWRFLRHLLHVAATNRTADF